MNVGVQPCRGQRCWVTDIEVGGDQFTFHAPVSKASRAAQRAEELVAAQMRTDRNVGGIIDNLEAIGAEFSATLLGHDTPASALAERAAAAEALGASKGAVIYKLGAPVPIELLTFGAPIGGVGRFERLLGGRPRAYSQNSARPGRVVGSGAVLFHDDGVASCRDGEVRDAIDVAFPDGVEPHRQLLIGDRGAAQEEIDRLFRATTASWIHFQCHGGEERQVRTLRLTNGFMVTQSAFTDPGARVAAIMLNTCSGARMGDWWTGSTDIPEGSWADYFTGECRVPAVIGPFCPVRDDRTMPFTRCFYDALSQQERVLEAFCSARSDRLDDGDFTAFAYRYIGPPELVVPEQARIVAYVPELSRAA